MKAPLRPFASWVAPLLFNGFGILATYGSVPSDGGVASDSKSTERAEIVHFLNRITFGPRPGDVERVEDMGLQTYIDQQLKPDTIDDSAVDQKVSVLPTLQFTGPELMAIYREQLQERILQQLEKKTEDTMNDAQRAAAVQQAQLRVQKLLLFEDAMPPKATPEEKQAILQKLLTVIHQRPVDELAEAKLIREVDSNRQLYEVLVDFWGNHFNIDMAKNDCKVLKVIDDRDVIRPHVLGKFHDLLEASAKSPAMLTYLDNALSSAGRASSAPVPGSSEMKMAEEQKLLIVAGKNSKGGINENYAREIMELHTLGVDGGYTQADVQEVARCFTGWSLNHNGEFQFYPNRHDNGPKVVLGHQIPANGGIQDGEMVLDILSSHPSTAHFISRELCQRFISDDPPKSVVDRTAAVFQKTGGDLREVVRSIITSPEFLSSSSFDSKIKSPLEFAVSAVRATGSTIQPPTPQPLAAVPPPTEMMAMALNPTGNALAGPTPPLINPTNPPKPVAAKVKRETLDYKVLTLGEPIFGCIPPTGYKEVSSVWVNPGALIDRLNFAIALTEQGVTDVRFDAHAILGQTDPDQPEAVLKRCVSTLLPGGVSDSTQDVLASAATPSALNSKPVKPATLVALVLGSPEFQRK